MGGRFSSESSCWEAPWGMGPLWEILSWDRSGLGTKGFMLNVRPLQVRGGVRNVEAEAESRLCHLLLCSLGQVTSPLGASVSSSVKWAQWYYPSHRAAGGKVKRGSTAGAQHRKQELLSLAPTAWRVAVRPGIWGLGRGRGCQNGEGQEGQWPELEGSECSRDVCRETGREDFRQEGWSAGLPPRIGRPPAPDLDERRP